MEQIEHLGIAVYNLEDGIRLYRDLLGFTLEGTEIVEEDKVKVAFLRCGPNRIELLEPLEEDSPVGKFLRKKGPGLQHVSYKTSNLEEDLERLKAGGVRLIDKTPRTGAEEKRVAFLNPKDTGGVLIELCEGED